MEACLHFWIIKFCLKSLLELAYTTVNELFETSIYEQSHTLYDAQRDWFFLIRCHQYCHFAVLDDFSSIFL